MVFSATAIHRWMGLLLQKRVNTRFHTSHEKNIMPQIALTCSHSNGFIHIFLIAFSYILLQLRRGLGGSPADRFIFIHIPIRTTCHPLLSKEKSYGLNETYCALFVFVWGFMSESKIFHSYGDITITVNNFRGPVTLILVAESLEWSCHYMF